MRNLPQLHPPTELMYCHTTPLQQTIYTIVSTTKQPSHPTNTYNATKPPIPPTCPSFLHKPIHILFIHQPHIHQIPQHIYIQNYAHHPYSNKHINTWSQDTPKHTSHPSTFTKHTLQTLHKQYHTHIYFSYKPFFLSIVDRKGPPPYHGSSSSPTL